MRSRSAAAAEVAGELVDWSETKDETREGCQKENASVKLVYYSARTEVAATRVGRMLINQGCHPRRFF